MLDLEFESRQDIHASQREDEFARHFRSQQLDHADKNTENLHNQISQYKDYSKSLGESSFLSMLSKQNAYGIQEDIGPCANGQSGRSE